MEFKIDKDNSGKRVDVFLNEKMDLTRNKIQKMIKDNYILVNNNPIKNGYILKEEDLITIEEDYETEITIVAEDIPINIVYEDEDVIIINKQAGMVVHPGNGNYQNTLVNAIMFHSKKLSSLNGEFRPGIVHRIDKDTSGLLIIAKNDKAHLALANELADKKTKRKYIALVWGVINTDTGTIDAPIGRDNKNRLKMAVTDINAKEAITHFTVLKRYDEVTLIECTLETGRTHQIRVHLNYIGYPVVNDPLYGRRKTINEFGQCLHASTIGFTHPTTNEYLEFNCDVPKEFQDIINSFVSRPE